MSIYRIIAEVGTKYMGKAKLFKHGFNLSPMYRRSTARITKVSDDLLNVDIKLPISSKNKNYVNSIFGGSMFAAVDPIPMVQLMNILGDDFVVWDKSAEIYFKRPAKEDLYAKFTYSVDELESIKAKVSASNEMEIIKNTALTNKNGEVIYCEVKKTIYVADKSYFKKKRTKKKDANQQIQ
jgi:acyl-CoA hydrolase